MLLAIGNTELKLDKMFQDVWNMYRTVLSVQRIQVCTLNALYSWKHSQTRKIKAIYMKGIWSNTLPNNINFFLKKEEVCVYIIEKKFQAKMV